MAENTNALRNSDRPQPELLDGYIRGCAAGDSEALSLLYLEVSRPVYAYALSVLKNRQDAEDLLHDCFINICSAAAGYVSCGKPMAWIMTVAKNLCMSRLRERSRRADIAEEDWESALSSGCGISAEDSLLLRSCMEKLSDTERKILVLHATAGFRHREIAEFLDMPLASVLSKYSRTVKKLRIILEKEISP